MVGVHRIVERLMFGGAVVARQLMNVSSSFDHRVIDGKDGARFTQSVRRLLEQRIARMRDLLRMKALATNKVLLVGRLVSFAQIVLRAGCL